MFDISGHHHISMLTKDANENNYFYQKILGFRRVKMTVNQDDPTMYHLFYGDKLGNPGTELTFFEMKKAGRTHRGTNAITQIGLLLPSKASLLYWKERLASYDVKHGKITTYANRPALHFEDKDGLRLVFVVTEDETSDEWSAWEESAVPVEHQIRGMGPIEFTVRRLDKVIATLTEIFNYQLVSKTEEEAILQAQKGKDTGEIVIKYLDGPRERAGRGSIHHLAIRAKDEEELAHWEEQVKKRGFASTKILDRYYFKSLYFRESNGLMLEIATDGPGFLVDSKEKTLGKQLDLPPFLEEKRKEIEEKLEPIKEIK